MMQWNQELKVLLKEQKQLEKRWKNVIKAYEKDDYMKEMQLLQKYLEVVESECREIAEKIACYEKETKSLKGILENYIIEEKLMFIKKEKEKLDKYFATREKGDENKLDMMRQQAKGKLGVIDGLIGRNNEK